MEHKSTKIEILLTPTQEARICRAAEKRDRFFAYVMRGNFQQRIGKLEARLEQKADTRGREILRQMVARWMAEHEEAKARRLQHGEGATEEYEEELAPQQATEAASLPEAEERPAMEDNTVSEEGTARGFEGIKQLFQTEVNLTSNPNRPKLTHDPVDDHSQQLPPRREQEYRPVRRRGQWATR
jgi:hypothetical protein